MGAHTMIPGQSFMVSFSARIASTISTSISLIVQIVDSGYAGGAAMGTCLWWPSPAKCLLIELRSDDRPRYRLRRDN